MIVRMALSRILIRETDDTHIIELREVDGERVFPILIGFHEAAAIERRLMGQTPPRPLTHDLMDTVLHALGGEIERISIDDLSDHTFYARLHLKQGDQHHEIDCRPSDAVALAAAHDVPIDVAEAVLDEVLGSGE